jgi:predicted transcriptional regulator
MDPTTDTKVTTDANNWSEVEHVSEQIQLEAQKLVHLAGNAEIAKHAINVASQAENSPFVTEATSTSQGPVTSSPTSPNSPNSKFLDALDDFERLLGLPVINGEMIEWATNVDRSFERVKALLLDRIQFSHRDVFARIVKEDLDLSSRVESLRERDSQIAGAELQDVERGLTALLQRAKAVGKDESQISEHLSSVTHQALMFIVSARAQETAITAWLNEAFNRDLGVSG